MPTGIYTIGQIPYRVSNPVTELIGARLEFETLTGPNGTPQGMSGTIDQLAAYLATRFAVGGAPQWALGKDYKEGAFAYDKGLTYRATQDVVNSQAAPGDDPNSFEVVGPVLRSAIVSLVSAKALPTATPPGVIANTLYGITGDWNTTGTDSTVYVHGVRPDAYHKMGIVYDAQGASQLLEVDVAAGTYKKLSGQTLYSALGNQEDGSPTNKLLQQVANSKADLVSGRVPVAQSRDVGYGLELDQNGSYALKDGALFYYRPTQLNRRVNPATGAIVTTSAATGYELTQTLATTAPALPFVTPGQRYQSTVPLFYAAWYNSFNQYVGPWSASTTDASFFSTAPAGANYLKFSVLTGKVDGPPELRITPAGVGAYDDTALKARVTTLEGLGGRQRGPWAANTAYKQYDMVVQASVLYYANASFTSGSTFDASNWTAIASVYDDAAVRSLIQNVGLQPGCTELWVRGGLTTGYTPQRGDALRPYPTLPAAQAAAQDGDLIRVQRGGTGVDAFGRPYYTELFLWEKNVTIAFEPGAIYGGIFQFAAFNANASFTRRTLLGGEFLGRSLLWRQSSADVDVLVIGARYTGLGTIEVNGQGSFLNGFVSTLVLRNCEVDSQLGAGNMGPVRVIGRDDMGGVAMELDNTPVSSPDTACVTFQANAASRLVLRGTTELRGPVAYDNQVTSPGMVLIPQSQWLVDARPVGSGAAGPTYTAGAGITISPQHEISTNSDRVYFSRWAGPNLAFLSSKTTNGSEDYQYYTIAPPRKVSEILPAGVAGYDPATGIFTAPYHGIYDLNAYLAVLDIAAGESFTLVLTNGTGPVKPVIAQQWFAMTASQFNEGRYVDKLELQANQQVRFGVGATAAQAGQDFRFVCTLTLSLYKFLS